MSGIPIVEDVPVMLGFVYPRSQVFMCGRRKKSLVHTVCACSVLPGFLGIWKFPVNLFRYTNLSEAHRLLPYKGCLPLTMLCVDDDEGAMKVLGSSLAGIVHMFIHSS